MSTDTATFACAKCVQINDTTAKFCGGCGQPLWENCPSCSETVRIGVKFCGGCGSDMQQRLEQRLAQVTESLTRARQLAQTHEFDEAMALAKRCCEAADFRFESLATQARQLTAQIEQAHHAWNAKCAKVLEAAQAAARNEDHARVKALIEKIPQPLRCEQLQRLEQHSHSADTQFSQLVKRLRDSLQRGDTLQAADAIESLLEIKPQEKSFAQAARRIGDSLLASAARHFEGCDYQAALDRLRAVPRLVRDERVDAMQRRAQRVQWLTRQLRGQPWATPQLARIAQRLCKSVPHDSNAKARLRELVTLLKQPSPDSTSPDSQSYFRAWAEQSRAWMGGRISLLAFPQCVQAADRALLEQHPGEFSVAIGLALQGLGKSFFTDTLYRAEAKSLKKFFKRKAPLECVGVDAGNSAIRAVRMRVAEDGKLHIVDLWHRPLSQPLCRAGLEMQQTVLQDEDLLPLKQWLGEGEFQVWINQPAREVLGKFVEMPPVSDKELQPLLDKEVKRCFPLAVDELKVARWVGPEETDCGRPVVLAATKTSAVTQRLAKFREVGIEPEAVQSEQLALANFAMREFMQQLQQPPEPSSAEQADAEQAPSPAIAMVDCGASGVTLLVVTEKRFFFRSIDGGGEELTAVLARAGKLTAAQAEELKRDPALIPEPNDQFAPLEERMLAISARLKRSVDEAKSSLKFHHVQAVWCVGGGSRMHGWVKQVLSDSPESPSDDNSNDDDDLLQ